MTRASVATGDEQMDWLCDKDKFACSAGAGTFVCETSTPRRTLSQRLAIRCEVLASAPVSTFVVKSATMPMNGMAPSAIALVVNSPESG